MEDLNKCETLYGIIKTLWHVVCVIAFLPMFVGALVDMNYALLSISLGVILVWYVVYLFIQMEEIIITRFLSMSENVSKITQHFEEKEENN